MSRLILAALLVLLAGAPALAQTKGAPKADAAAASDAAGRIAALKTKGGSDAWDDEVEAILVAAFDKNKSDDIDTEEELGAIPCEVWQTLDKSIRAGGAKDASLIATYGFGPKGDYHGDSLGIDETLRKAAHARIEACGVKADK